jgi:ATP-dependent RNA helicase RhlB
MALSFIKKLAGRLLGKTAGENAPANQSGHAKKGAPSSSAKPQRGHGHGPASRAGNPAPRHGAEERPRGPRRERPTRVREGGRPEGGRPEGGQPPGRDGRRPPRERDHSRGEGFPPAAASGRSVARPPRQGRGSAEERPRSDPRVRRPGGAVADDEQVKRLAAHAAWSQEQYQVAPAEGKRRFQDFDLPSEILHAVADLGFQYCTPIQALSLEHALAGKNVTGKAQTGTGKTAAFLVAILTRYLRSPEARQEQGGAPRALVIAPTRELVIQICKDADSLGKYCGLRSLAVYGGMDYERQKREVSVAPVDLLVATPGRLLDFVRSRVIDLSKVDTLVIDEADRMLDMGFIPDVRSIINRLPPKDKRGTMLYSATLTDDVMKLASQWMEAPVCVETETEQVTTKTVKQVVYVVTANEKFTVLYNHIQQFPDSRILVFCNRRSTTEDVVASLARRGIHCEMLSGDVNQNRRLRVLEDFREGKVRIVVATDVAGRGLHVDDIGFVINFDFPYEPEDYVHRIGRTGRAGASGTAISFADEDESFIIPDIEKYIGEELKCTMLQGDDPLLAKLPDSRPGGHRGPRSESREGDQPREPRRQADHVREPSREEGGKPVAEPPAPAEHAAPPQPQGELLPPEPPPAPPPRPAETAGPTPPVERPRVEREPRPAPAPAKPKDYPRETHPRPPAPAAAPGAVAGRRPRFSEEWVPGQSAK